jgi:uncharacterized protein with NRDE domain
VFVTQHAAERIRARLGDADWDAGYADRLVARLEAMPGQAGVRVYLTLLGADLAAPDGSNGDILVAIAGDGSVDTVYLRRRGQRLDAGYFGARSVHWVGLDSPANVVGVSPIRTEVDRA